MKKFRKIIISLVVMLMNAEAAFADIPALPRPSEDAPATGDGNAPVLIIAAAVALIAAAIIIRMVRRNKGK